MKNLLQGFAFAASLAALCIGLIFGISCLQDLFIAHLALSFTDAGLLGTATACGIAAALAYIISKVMKP